MDALLKADVTLPPEDLASIEQATRDYIESWFTADAQRLRSCLHPDLAKRTVAYDPNQGSWSLRHTDAEMLVTFAAEGHGSRTPPEVRIQEITILDTSRNTACVKVTSFPFVDYLHVARFDQRWLIVNALWEQRA